MAHRGVLEDPKTESSFAKMTDSRGSDLRSERGHSTVWLIDRSQKVLAFNHRAREAARAIWGREVKKGDFIRSYVEKEFWGVFQRDLEHALRGEMVRIEREIRGLHQTGQFCEMTYTPVYEDYAVSGICLTVTAMSPPSESNELVVSTPPEHDPEPTDARRIELIGSQLIDELNRYRDFYENAPDGYGSVDRTGIVQAMNKTMLNWLGYQRDQVVGEMRWEEFLTPATRGKVAHLIDRCIREGGVENVEIEFVRENGGLMPVRLNIKANRDSQGRYQGFRATARDITTEKELEAQLLQAQKLQSLGTLAGGIAHDFNNMLTGIMGFTQLLLREIEGDGKVYEGLKRIELLSERAAEMVRQLLAFGRHGICQKRTLSLHPFLQEMSTLLERTIPESIQIELDLMPEDPVLEADPTQLQQVMMNLAVNARDAMPQGGTLRIETRRVDPDEEFCRAHPEAQPGPQVRISVSDTGIGVPPDIRPRIFDPFFTTKEVGKGTGLGLPVVYGIVKNHGGTVEVQSEVENGTAILIYLPLSGNHVDFTASRSVDVAHGTETILLVEDDESVLELSQAALEHFGYRVLTAPDGIEAISVFKERQNEISLVVIDVVMPRLGGRGAILELKRIDPDVKVVLATGYGGVCDTADELLQENICGIVRKPYHVEDMARTVRAALDDPIQRLGRS